LYNNLYFIFLNKNFYTKIDIENKEVSIFGNVNKNWNKNYLQKFVFTPIIEILMRLNGFFSLHAGGVSKGKDCLLILGNSGVGKTLNTLMFLKNGYKFMGDDTIFLDNSLNVYPFLKPIHLTKNSFRYLNNLKSVNIPKIDKETYFVDDLLYKKQYTTRSKKIKRVYFLDSKRDKNYIKKIKKSDCFKRILSYSLVPISKKSNLEQMKIIEELAKIPTHQVGLKNGEFLKDVI
jgi:hypothetical protein